jgi:predicted TIM-barrel fold metal-dependent hydrolase
LAGPGVEWIETVPLSSADKNKIMHGNARRLL